MLTLTLPYTLVNNDNSYHVSKRQRGSMVDSNARYRLSNVIEWESNQKSFRRVLSLSWIFNLIRVFVHVDTVYKCILVILMNGKPLFKLVSCVRSLLQTGHKVCPSTAYTHSLREVDKILMGILGLVYLIK